MSISSKTRVLRNILLKGLGLVLLLYVVDFAAWMVESRRWSGVEQTHRVLRQWRLGLFSYHVDYDCFPLDSRTVGEVAILLTRKVGDRNETPETIDGFGRPLMPGCRGRGWSQVISCGRDGISQCGDGDDIFLDMSRVVEAAPSRHPIDRNGPADVEK